MKRLLKWAAVACLCAVALYGVTFVFAAGYSTGGTAGTSISVTYEGRKIDVLESELTHPTHADGFVDKGDQVECGNRLVGVALNSAEAATDYVVVDTEGIWNLSVTATAAMTVGDAVFINATTAALSDTNTDKEFGYILADLSTTGSAVVCPIKVHYSD